MTLNWDNIKYLFQIPVDWFKAIHNKIFKAYGTNFIIVKDGDDGAMNVDVDEELFEQAVRQYIPELSGDYVKSVDGIGPDANGNVELSGVVRSVDSISPDAAGNVALSGYVKTIDDVKPDENGNVSGVVFSVDDIPADEYGNVELSGVVKTINGSPPDENGNMNLSATLSGVVLTSDINNANSPNPVASYTYNNIRYTGNLPGGLDNLYNWVGAYHRNTLDDEISSLGYIKLSGELSALSGYVKSVDGISADGNGNVELSNIVKMINNTPPDISGNISGVVFSVDSIEPDENGNVELSGVVRTVDSIEPDENGNVALSGVVRTVEDIEPDENGNVSFGLDELRWVVTDEYGYLTTTTDKPAVLVSAEQGYMYNEHGIMAYIDMDFVDLSTDQDVEGVKTWKEMAIFNSDTVVYVPDYNQGYIRQHVNTTHAAADDTALRMGGYNKCVINMKLSSDPGSDQSQFVIERSNYGGGTFTTIRDGGSSMTSLRASNILQLSAGQIMSLSSQLINIECLPNMATLQNPPGVGALSNSIATVGWCESQLSNAISVYVKTVNNIQPDANGNVAIAVPSLSGCVLTSDINNAGSAHPVASYTYNNIKYTGNLPGGLDNLYNWVGCYDYNTLDDEITGLGYVKNSALSSYVKEVDGHQPDANGAVSFGLTASKWVKSDSQGHLTTTNDTPVTVDTTQWTPQNATFNFVKNVTWNGTKLQRVVCSLQFVNGVLVTVGNDVTEDIDIAVTYNP